MQGGSLTKKIRWLPDLVLFEDYKGNWDEYLRVLYSYFVNDFIKSKPNFQGIKLALKKHPIIEGKEATFWHIISEGYKEEDRTPDLRRCERIRWPSPIIGHSEDEYIKLWKNKRNNENRICLWIEQEEYLVVLAERKGYILLWTSYMVVQHHRKRKLQKEYETYINAKAAQ